jgi:guanylate kinase
MQPAPPKPTQPTAKAGRLYVVSAPSGAGKTSLVKALMEREPELRFSVSYTTRTPRANEVGGRDYHFINADEFQRMVERGEFLEHAQVFDNFYGTARATVREALAAGKLLLLEIDWQGARQVRASMPAAHSIALEERLTARSTDSPEVIRRRLKDAQRDIAHWIEFDYVVINDGFEQAVTDFQAVVRERGEALRGSRPQVARLAVELLA